MLNYVIFCDGGSRGNPGLAACAFVVKEGFVEVKNSQILVDRTEKIIFERGLFLGIQTNNVAEWQSLLLALTWADQNLGRTNSRENILLQICMDSNLVIQQIQGKWQVKQAHLRPFFEDCKQLTNKFNNLNFFHIYREYNKQADTVVNRILDIKIDF